MKLYNKNAESVLFEKVKSITATPNAWRCIYFSFSSIKEEIGQNLRTHMVVNIIRELLQDENGYVYFCEDGDIFILFDGITQKIIAKLGESIGALVGKGKEEAGQFCTIFDLSHSWQVFYALTEGKFAKVQKKQEKILEPKPAPVKKTPPIVFNSELFSRSKQKRADRQRLLVQVVEDDAFTRRLVSGVLKPMIDIVESADGESALEQYQNYAPDMVFLDIELPDINGHAILQKIVSQDKQAFVVMLSGNSHKENILAALEDGAQGFVAKPFPKEKLLHYVKTAQVNRAGAHA